MQQSSLQATWTTHSQFWAMVDQQGQIIATDITGSRVVGVVLDKYRAMEKAAAEAVEKAEGYYKTLEEHGLIKRELTQEEQIAALTAQVQALTEIVTAQIKKEPVNEPDQPSVNSKQFIAAKQPLASKAGTGQTNSGSVSGKPGGR